MLSTRVLLIEDDPAFQGLVRQFLEQRSYDVLCAQSGEQALQLVKQDNIDVVICDLNLPGMSGLEVLESLLHSFAQLPIIVISASQRMSDIREAIRLGAWDYMVKPVEQLESIDLAIQNCLDRTALESSWENERWEFDDHIDVLFDNDRMVQQLAEDLTPHEPLHLCSFEINHQAPAEQDDSHWVDYHRLPNNQALVVIASAQALAGQSLLSLLVLKTIFNPIVRTASSNHPQMLTNPHKVLERINAELCHSKMKAAFDLVLIWLDGETGTLHWGHAGTNLRLSLESKPDLALGIWAHAHYQGHQGIVESGDKLSIGDNNTCVHISNCSASSVA